MKNILALSAALVGLFVGTASAQLVQVGYLGTPVNEGQLSGSSTSSTGGANLYFGSAPGTAAGSGVQLALRNGFRFQGLGGLTLLQDAASSLKLYTESELVSSWSGFGSGSFTGGLLTVSNLLSLTPVPFANRFDPGANSLYMVGQFGGQTLAFETWRWENSNPTAGAGIRVAGVYEVQSFTPVPEPSTYGLIGAAGLVGFVVYRRSRQQRAGRVSA